MTETVAVVAITNVTFDGRRYRPGAEFRLPQPCAHALEAAGNVRYADTAHSDDEEPRGTGEGGGQPAAPAPPPAPPSEPAATQPVAQPAPPEEGTHDEESKGAAGAAEPAAPALIPLEEVSGIGPTTAERLRAAGVADVAALAALDDARLDELRVRASWRDQARKLAGD